MGLTHPSFQRALAAFAAVTVVAGGIAAATTSASADTANPTPVSLTALPTVQTNGVVWTQSVVNGVDYVGGQFTASRPAGSPVGSNETGRSNLLAYDVTSGAAIGGFSATTNGAVRAITASADGSRIYIAGSFTTVNGQPRTRVAALSPGGALLGDFAPSVNGTVSALAVRGTTVYLGGSFTQVGGAARARAAAVSSSGATLSWNPDVADYSVKAVTVSPDGTKVLLGGAFTTVGGASGRDGLAAVDSASGAVQPWKANDLLRDSGANAAILSLSSRGGVAYATAYSYKSGGNLEGGLAMNWSDGSIVWVDACHGDTYAGVPFNDAFYVAGHPHTCEAIGGFEESDPTVYHRGIGFSLSAGPNRVSDQTSFNGQPAPKLLDWYPEFNAGTYTGLFQGPWSVAQGSGFLVYGGEFTKVNGSTQQGLVRFQGTVDGADPIATPVATPTPDPTATPTTDPTAPTTDPTAPTTDPTSPTTDPTGTAPVTHAPSRVAHPNAVPLGPTRVAVKWSAPKSASADKVSGYAAKIYKGKKLVKTVKVGAAKRSAVITGLKKSTSYRVGVVAVNAKGSSRISVLDAAKTKAKGKNVSATKKPTKVKQPTVSSGAARVRVRWAGASAKGALGITRYQVRLMRTGAVAKVLTVDDAMRSKLVKKLGRNATYSISVRAYNWAGWGSWSSAKVVRTR